MKTPSDELFKLIRSLNTQEKVYFKKDIINKKGSMAYVKTFDIVDKMKIYDEEKLKMKLNNFIKVSHFKSLKSRTYESILKSLQNYHSDDSISTLLSGKIQQTELLLHKQLYSAALKIIDKSLKIAMDHEQFLYTLQLLRLKMETIKHNEDVDGFKRYSRINFQKELEYINKYSNQVEYCQLMYKLFPLVKTNLVEGIIDSSKQVKAILNNPLLKKIRSAASYDSLKYYYQIMMIASRAKGDWKESYRVRKKLVKLVESYKPGHSIRAHDYIPVIHNFLTSIKHMNKPDEYELYYNKARMYFNTLPKKQQTPDIYQYYLSLQVSYLGQQIHLGNYQKAAEVINEVEKLTKTSSINIIENIIFFCCFAFETYFILGHYKPALRYLNRLNSYEYSGVKQDIIFSFRPLHLIVHYEAGNTDMLPGMAGSIRRYLLKRRFKFNYADLLLDLFEKHIPKADSKEKLITLFKTSAEQMKRIFKNKTEAKALNYFDYISWMESQIENKPFAEIVRKKRLQKFSNQK